MHLGSSSTCQNSKGHVTDGVVVFVWEKIEVRHVWPKKITEILANYKVC